jgi:hypothetical protein
VTRVATIGEHAKDEAGAPQEKPRLFVSHSSQDKTLTDAVISALEPGFDVLIDTNCLQAGQEWPNQLNAMMAYAHAGLLLFTRAAMNRPDWIRKEAYILTWRRSLDPEFKVFYTYFDGVNEQNLTASGFDPAHLGLIQRLQATEPLAIAAEIGTFKSYCLRQTPFEQLTFSLSQHLKLNASALEHFATKLRAPPIPWLPNADNNRVNRIAARVLAGQFGTIQNLKSLINELKALGIQSESLDKLMRWVGPYWLPPEAAGRLAAVTHDLWKNKIGGWAAINGQCVMQYTAKMFVHKVLPFQFECRIAHVESASDNPDADYYTQAICKWLRKDNLSRPEGLRVEYSDDDQELIQQLEQDDPFLFVPLRAPPDKETVKKLRDNFPKVVFLLWTGNDLIEPTDYDFPVISLKPPVEVQQELVEFVQWRTALRSLGG